MQHTVVTQSQHKCLVSPALAMGALLALAAFVPQAFAGETITWPGNGAMKPNPFGVIAGAAGNALVPSGPTGNTVTVNGSVRGYVYGGAAVNGNTENNTVTVNRGTIQYDVYGGKSDTTGKANSNTVTINGGRMRNITGGEGADGAQGNTVRFVNGAAGTVIGGAGVNGDASYNTVEIVGGSLTNYVTGGQNSVAGNANYNTVIMSGGSVARDISGGTAQSNANYNTVIFTGGYAGGDVVGGHTQGGNATYNTVTIGENARFSAGSSIYGGATPAGGAVRDVTTGNTLNMRGWKGSLKQVGNFANYNFTLPGNMHNGDAVVQVTGGTATDLSNTTVRVMGMSGGGTILQNGDKVHLIQNAAGVTTNGINLGAGGKLNQGILLTYDYVLATDPKAVSVQITGTPVIQERTAVISEGRAATMGAVNMGADMMAGMGMDNARQAGQSGLSSGDMDKTWGLTVFTAITGGALHNNVGSGSDVSGTAFALGFAKTWQLSAVDIMMGAFFEGGASNYQMEKNGATGDGKGTYYGGGLLARMDLTDSILKGLYVEASARTGKTNSQYENNADNLDASYTVDAPYSGLHGGLGYLWNMTEKATLDVYGKYFWVRQFGSSADIMGDKFTFHDADSQRVRAGARMSYAFYEGFKAYAGAAYEHEFDGKSRVSAYSLDLASPSVKGVTGVGELGVSFSPTSISGLTLDVGVQGYTGKREGVMGNVQMRYEF